MNAVCQEYPAIRLSHVIHRNLVAPPPVARTAKGLRIIDANGRTYLDASGGAAVSCLGHAHPDVLAALHAQIDTLAYAHTSFFSSESAEALAVQLATHAPEGLNSVYFTSGGSEGIEAALKLARQYYVEIGQPGRAQVVARHSSYHGSTLGTLAVGANEDRRRPFVPLLMGVSRVSACNAYRGLELGESVEDYTQRLLEEIDQTFCRIGPDKVMAFIAETVVGATGGAVPPTENYFKGVRALCDRYGILYIADEVMCGMGRTGTLHAVEVEGVIPDLLVVAKGLGGGYQPIGAVLAHQRLVDAIRNGSGAFMHSHTYTGHPTAACAALAVQQVIQRDGLLPRVRARGDLLKQLLSERLNTHANVGDIRGRGLFVGIEFVADRVSKRPFDPAIKLHAKLKASAMAHGLLIYPSGGTVDGYVGDHILLAPPFIVTEDDVVEVVDRLCQVIDNIF